MVMMLLMIEILDEESDSELTAGQRYNSWGLNYDFVDVGLDKGVIDFRKSRSFRIDCF